MSSDLAHRSFAIMIYTRYQPMIAAADLRPALWRVILALVTIAVLIMAWVVGLIYLFSFATSTDLATTFANLLAPEASTPIQVLFILTAVGGLFPTTWLAARIWSGRSLASLIGPGARSLRHFVIAAGVALVTLTIVSVATWPIFETPVPSTPFATWITWLPLALIVLALQTGGEELLFRGYLQSQIARRFRSDKLAILLPSILFGFMHYNPELPLLSALGYVVITAVFGILAADLTMRTGSIGAAWGLHFINNFFGILVVTPDGTLSGLALWSTGGDRSVEALASPLAAIEIFMLVLLWFLIRKALRV